MIRKFIKISAYLIFAYLVALVLFSSPHRSEAGVGNLTKKILPVSRLMGNFDNPYAVQNGDVLQVVIDYDISNVDAVIKDEFYNAHSGPISSNAICGWPTRIPQNLEMPAGVTESHDLDSVNFTISANGQSGNLQGTIKYLCQVNVTNKLSVSANLLPEIMAGVLSLQQSGLTYYAGMSSSEIILNYDVNLPLIGFIRSNLEGNCSKYRPEFPLGGCYSLENYQTINKMVSQTRIDESGTLNYVKRYEIATLLYPDNIIIGDAYSTAQDNYLSKGGINFSFYGRNLSQRGSDTPSSSSAWGTGPSWKVSSAINAASQSYYNPANEGYYNQRINQLRGEAQTITNATLNSSNDWYLQCDSITLGCDDNVARSKNPEGKVWRVDGNVTVTRTNIKYHGVGTIIISGTLTFVADSKILPDTKDDFMGVIVLVEGGQNVGVTFRQGRILDGSGNGKSNTTFQGAIFCKKVLNMMGAGLTLVGSFVTGGFNFYFPGAKVYYDHRLDTQWPPGFRYFNMPTPKSSSP